MWWIKIRRDTLGVSKPSPRPDHVAQDSSMGKESLINSGYKNQWGLGQQNKLLVAKESPFKGHTKTWNVCKPTNSGNHHQGNS